MSDNVGQSYNEQILQSIIDGSQYVNENPYPSRIEQLLMELKEVIEQGGGSGVVVDQTYSETSTNAQSGTAVAQALETIPTQVNADWDATEGAAVILHKPTIPAEQVQADWTEENSASKAYIAHKPSLANVATSGDYDDLLNKPTIPTVDQSYSASSTNAQSGTAVASAISGKISATDYATQNTGGTIKAWTTTDGSDTILHLATQ